MHSPSTTSHNHNTPYITKYYNPIFNTISTITKSPTPTPTINSHPYPTYITKPNLPLHPNNPIYQHNTINPFAPNNIT